MHSPTSNTQNGFTIVEVLVATSIFVLAVVSVTTVFTDIISLQDNIYKKQQVLNDLRLTLDTMAKEITSGSALPQSCEDGCSSILFSTKARPDLNLRNIAYRLNGSSGRIEKAIQTPYGLCSTLDSDGYPDENCFQPISSKQVDINSLDFYIQNIGESGIQPIISMNVDGMILPNSSDSEQFQTSLSITPRLLQDPNAQPPADNEPPSVTIEDPTSNDSYTTDEETIALGGSASDNDEVDYLEWRNERTNESGTVNGTNDWSTADIDLDPDEENTIVVTAYDEVGNVANDTLDVNTSFTPPPEMVQTNRRQENCDTPDDGLRAEVWEIKANYTDKVVVQRCTGSGCGGSDYQTQKTFTYSDVQDSIHENYWDNTVQDGTTYRWRSKAFNTKKGQESGWWETDLYLTPEEYHGCADIDHVDAWQVCPDGAGSENTVRLRIYGMYDHDGFEMQRCNASKNNCSSSDYFADTNVDQEVGTADDNTDGINPYTNHAYTQDITENIQPNNSYSWRGRTYFTDSDGNVQKRSEWKDGEATIDPSECSNDDDGGGDDGDDGDNGDNGDDSYDFTIDPSNELIEVKVSGTVTTRRKSSETTLVVDPEDPSVFDKDVNWNLSDDAGIDGIQATFDPNPLQDGDYSDGSDFYVTIPDDTPTGTYELEVQGTAADSNNPTHAIYLDVQESGGGQQ
jgi:type II secretory pathway pseudopilin PulG